MTALEVHQTVHGYSDGHRLLAASRRLPRDAERALLIMTDISGPVTAGAFQSYLTGMPLPGTTAYAVARTWLADELNRPGCVWTHTLLVSREDLGRIPDLRTLCALHRRPRKGGPWSSYGESLAFPLLPPEPGAAPAPDWTERGAARTLAALYGVLDRPAFLEENQSDRLESLVLAVWSQAWARLRGALRFCSWSLAPRTLDGEPLDLQVVPTAVGRHLRHTGTAGTFVTPIPRFGQEPDDPTPAWAQAGARDLVHDGGGSLRAFLRDFGDELGPGRAAFAPLVETHEEMEAVREGRAPLSKLTDAVGARFGAPLASRLKEALSRPTPGPTPGSAPSSQSPACVPTGPLSEGLAVEPVLAEPVLAERLVTPPILAQPAVAELGLADPVTIPPILAESPSGVTEPVVASLPLLAEPAADATRPAMEKAPPAEPLVTEAPVAEPVRIGPPMTAEPLEPERLATERDPATVAEVLDRLDRIEALEEVADLAARWRHILAAHPADVAQWLARARRPRAGTAAVAASVLDPHAPETRRIGVDAWLRAVVDAERQLDAATHVRLMAFLLALALAHRGPDGATLAARAFAPVDHAVATGELSPGAWQVLAADLPTLPWWRESDHGERLRRGIVERLMRDRWAPRVLLEATRDDEAFQRLVVICEWTREGQALLKQLAGHVSQGRIEATPGQRAVLARYA